MPDHEISYSTFGAIISSASPLTSLETGGASDPLELARAKTSSKRSARRETASVEISTDVRWLLVELSIVDRKRITDAARGVD